MKPAKTSIRVALLLVLSVVSFLPVKGQFVSNEYAFINWYFQDKGEKVYVVKETNLAGYSSKDWGGQYGPFDTQYLSNRQLRATGMEDWPLATEVLTEEDLKHMIEDSEEPILLDEVYLAENIHLINEEDYNAWHADSTLGYYSIGRPLFNSDKSVCVIYIFRVISIGVVHKLMPIYVKEEEEWKLFTVYNL